MRLVHGSMTDPAGARAGDLAAAQGRLVAAVLPDPAHPLRAPLPWLPLARGASLGQLATHLATSQSAQALQAGAALPAMAFDPAAAREAVDLAGAVARQWWSLQAQWVDGLAELAQEMGEVRQANTVSKFVDQEVNLVQQGLALVSSQATATVRLMENIQVNLAWWVGQRARPPA
ncbi:hypothetical protein [Piscinibacter gummiphilus]|uniref:Uncharacterized protein n=1 Tax=Piscinibacter gummiphilus TaxID=946333 RepID=A0A1W6LCL2_9BURK|nr:hypothetical protein [Piscinibacter gummiphilus]ARN22000.1 hypothetical protein A4W93_20025 [Piscinibacter gummiphilus]ATU66684.1 hypothetical protein CPZ87_20120 [Piscinibacter gummiphilus]GLS94072.1 hypothetical protein GCM10007918_13640 [Piscinibacter gummiphilus]